MYSHLIVYMFAGEHYNKENYNTSILFWLCFKNYVFKAWAFGSSEKINMALYSRVYLAVCTKFQPIESKVAKFLGMINKRSKINKMFILSLRAATLDLWLLGIMLW